MSGATTAALIVGGLGLAGTAYSARQQRNAADDQRDAAKNAAAKSQTQGSDVVQNFKRKRSMQQGFDAAPMASLVGGSASGGGLLGS